MLPIDHCSNRFNAEHHSAGSFALSAALNVPAHSGAPPSADPRTSRIGTQTRAHNETPPPRSTSTSTTTRPLPASLPSYFLRHRTHQKTRCNFLKIDIESQTSSTKSLNETIESFQHFQINLISQQTKPNFCLALWKLMNP